MRRPFEVDVEELNAHIDEYVDTVFADLSSSFLALPKGTTFIEYQRFQEAYETLKRTTAAFRNFNPDTVWEAMREDALAFVVLRTILGMSPAEWAELTRQERGVSVDTNAARSLEARARRDRSMFAGGLAPKTEERLRAMVATACDYITQGAPPAAEDAVHRLNKIDTAEGLVSLQHVADFHVPYAVLLYERYLGRPFASHRDAVSELVGDVMESAIESRLQHAHITFRKTARAERIPGFEQAPDFLVPTEVSARVVIEAKMAGDDGTARDKVARIIRLCNLSRGRVGRGEQGFEVVACIDGRGFGVRREDMRQLLRETRGKVFTMATLDQLIAHTALADFVPDKPAD